MNQPIDLKTPTRKYRRVVTGQVNGKSAIVSDLSMQAYAFQAVPGFEHTFLWATNGFGEAIHDPTSDGVPASIVPARGESALQIVSYPLDAARVAPTDPAAAAREIAARLPGLAETYEKNAPGMHATWTIDYAILLEGELWLEVDDGMIVHLAAGDIVVQQATRHAWRNKGQKPAIMAYVMLGLP